MTDQPKSEEAARKRAASEAERKARLAEQLRANLRLRKAQARAMADPTDTAENPDPA